MYYISCETRPSLSQRLQQTFCILDNNVTGEDIATTTDSSRSDGDMGGEEDINPPVPQHIQMILDRSMGDAAAACSLDGALSSSRQHFGPSSCHHPSHPPPAAVYGGGESSAIRGWRYYNMETTEEDSRATNRMAALLCMEQLNHNKHTSQQPKDMSELTMLEEEKLVFKKTVGRRNGDDEIEATNKKTRRKKSLTAMADDEEEIGEMMPKKDDVESVEQHQLSSTANCPSLPTTGQQQRCIIMPHHRRERNKEKEEEEGPTDEEAWREEEVEEEGLLLQRLLRHSLKTGSERKVVGKRGVLCGTAKMGQEGRTLWGGRTIVASSSSLEEGTEGRKIR
eukprot:GHVS01102860.1.p1 GENE.GHVS01102860.1~~GHVS01102860.1.p1  ORF type:complete len:338 (+),score=112.66 GHVS01102860.1:58-1071(+)